MMKIIVCAVIVFSALQGICVYAAEDESLSPAAYTFAEQAYAALASGDVGSARQSVDAALRLQPGNKQLGLLQVDIDIHLSDFTAAQQHLDKLSTDFPNDAGVLAQRGYFAQRQHRYQEAMNDFYAALTLPGITDVTQQRGIRLSWADCALLTKQPRVAVDALAPYKNVNDPAIQLRLANAYWNLGERDAAHQAALLAERLANDDEEMKMAHQLVIISAPVVISDLDQAYNFLREKNDVAAVKSFRHAFDQIPGSAAQYLDAGYAAKRIGDNISEVEWFSNALDVDKNATPNLLDKQKRFAYRRSNEERSRRWGVTASMTYQVNGFAAPTNNLNVLQGGLETYWRPEGESNHDGKLLHIFVRGFENFWDGSGGQVGAQTIQGDIGVRYKPFSEFGLILIADKLFRIGSLSTDDSALRFAYSSGAGGDIDVAHQSWTAWSFYTDGTYFVNASHYVQSLEARYGRSWRLDNFSENFVVTPHFVMSGDYDDQAIKNLAVGYGPGISLRYWFREDEHHAPASWCDLILQYREESTQSNRAHGFSLRSVLWY